MRWATWILCSRQLNCLWKDSSLPSFPVIFSSCTGPKVFLLSISQLYPCTFSSAALDDGTHCLLWLPIQLTRTGSLGDCRLHGSEASILYFYVEPMHLPQSRHWMSSYGYTMCFTASHLSHQCHLERASFITKKWDPPLKFFFHLSKVRVRQTGKHVNLPKYLGFVRKRNLIYCVLKYMSPLNTSNGS